jgi:ribosome-binding protein aMBF1 (putative translation factor)
MLQCEPERHEVAAAHGHVVGPPSKAAVHKAIGQAIQRTRRERGHTQEALALKAGIDPSELDAIEHGKLNPTIETLLKITSQLDISAYALLRRAGL